MRLRRAREARGWSRPELAAQMQRQEEWLRTGEAIRLDSKLVEKWERGQVRPRLFYQCRLCLLLEVDDPRLVDLTPSARLELEIRRLRSRAQAPAPSPSSPAIWCVPHRRDPFSTDPADLLRQLHRLLAVNGSPIPVSQYPLYGITGADRTRIALEYAYRYGSRYSAALWVRMATIECMRADLRAFAELIDRLVPTGTDQRLLSAVRGWLRDHEGWLLVLEEVEDQEPLLALLPAECNGHVLVTSRVEGLPRLARAVHRLSGHEQILLAAIPSTREDARQHPQAAHPM